MPITFQRLAGKGARAIITSFPTKRLKGETSIIRIHVCDRPEKYEQLRSDLQGAVGPKLRYLLRLLTFFFNRG